MFVEFLPQATGEKLPILTTNSHQTSAESTAEILVMGKWENDIDLEEVDVFYNEY